MVALRGNEQLSRVFARAGKHVTPRRDWQARVFASVQRKSKATSRVARAKRRWWWLVATESLLVCALSLMVVVGKQHTMSVEKELVAMRAQEIDLVNQLSESDNDHWLGEGQCACPVEARVMQCGSPESTTTY